MYVRSLAPRQTSPRSYDRGIIILCNRDVMVSIYRLVMPRRNMQGGSLSRSRYINPLGETNVQTTYPRRLELSSIGRQRPQRISVLIKLIRAYIVWLPLVLE